MRCCLATRSTTPFVVGEAKCQLTILRVLNDHDPRRPGPFSFASRTPCGDQYPNRSFSILHLG